MAARSTTKAASTKAAVLEDETVAEETVAEPTTKSIVNEGIVKVIDATGIDIQKNRYKAMRAIAWQAFLESVESGDFEALVDRAIANIDDLPTGWEIERPVKEAEAPAKPAAKKAPAKTPAKPAAKAAAKPAAATTARRRPTR